jgi:GDPmannose 4,6-dehydratase
MNKENMKKALVTGISGQDGYFLSKLLISKGYKVIGLTRNLENLNSFEEELKNSIKIVVGEITNEELLNEIITEENFDEIYNLASVATVASPWEDVANLVNVVAKAPIKIFDIVKNKSPKTKIFQASSAEIFGDSMEFPQNEETLPRPKTPYAVSKLFVDQMAKLYRGNHNIFICSGILQKVVSLTRYWRFRSINIRSLVSICAH